MIVEIVGNIVGNQLAGKCKRKSDIFNFKFLLHDWYKNRANILLLPAC